MSLDTTRVNDLVRFAQATETGEYRARLLGHWDEATTSAVLAKMKIKTALDLVAWIKRGGHGLD